MTEPKNKMNESGTEQNPTESAPAEGNPPEAVTQDFTESTPEPIPTEETKTHGIGLALVKKLSFAVMGGSLLFALLSFIIAAGYREDPSKIPSFRLSLIKSPQLITDNSKDVASDVSSPLDNLSAAPKHPQKENIPPSPEPDYKKEQKNGKLLAHNDFGILDRKVGKYTSLNIIDPLPVMTVSHLGNQIPVISESGDVPWKVYAKPFDDQKTKGKTKLAVLISYAGLDDALTQKIIDAFDENVSISFSPYTKNLKEQIEKARTAGKETYVNLPVDVSKGDPGPYGIMEELTADENFSRFMKAIGRGVAISGLLNIVGKESALPENRIRKMISMINQHGLVYIGPQKSLGDDIVVTFDDNLFNDLNRWNIRKNLDAFLQKAKTKRAGLLIVDSKPSALVETLHFMDSLALNEDIVFVPVSVLVNDSNRQES